jgi:TolB-like protein
MATNFRINHGGTKKMTNRYLSKLVCFTVILFALSTTSWAGQAVTKSVKKWAKRAVKQEKALKTVSAPNTLAVLYFQNQTGMPDLDLLQKGLAVMLITDLSKLEKIQVVERIKIQAIVEELGFGEKGLVDPKSTAHVGKLLGVEYLVGGDIIKKKANNFQLSSNLLKVPSEKIFGRPEVKGKLIDQLLSMEKELLFEIIKILKIEISPSLMAELKKPLSTDINALTNLFSGVENSDRGDYKKADEFYNKALKADPNMTVAKDASLELKSLGLVSSIRKPPALLQLQRDSTSYTDRIVPAYPNKRLKSPNDIAGTADVNIEWQSIPRD